MGPWTKALAEALGGGQSELEVEGLRVEPGFVTARVGECTVTLSAPTIRPRLWAAVVRSASGRGLERAVRGEVQSEQLQHLLEHDWEEPLVPPAAAIVRVCSCDTSGRCDHVAAVARDLAAAIEADPAELLRWRGCLGDRPAVDDPWRGGVLPALPLPARRPPQSTLQRFGASGVRAGDEDVLETLLRVYASFGD